MHFNIAIEETDSPKKRKKTFVFTFSVFRSYVTIQCIVTNVPEIELQIKPSSFARGEQNLFHFLPFLAKWAHILNMP